MESPLFSVIIPTIGRTSIAATLRSIRHQNAPAEVLVVFDTFRADPLVVQAVGIMAESYGARFLTLDAGRHDTGSPQLAYGFSQAEGEWILNLGDDDRYVEGAFEIMKRVIDRQDDCRPLLFRAELHPAAHRQNTVPILLWDRQEIAQGHVTGQNFCCPNDQARLGTWTNDWTFIRSTVEAWDGDVEWRDEVTVRCY